MAIHLLRALEKLSLGVRQYHHSCQHASGLKNTSVITAPLFLESQTYDTSSLCYKKPLKLKELNSRLPTKSYHLPGSAVNNLNKHTILDPVTAPKQYELPTNVTLITDKLSPALTNIVPVEDPHTLQKIIEHGGNVEKMTMPWMLRLRKQMHNKHARKKRKKRDVFIRRKVLRVRAEKREVKMQEYEQKKIAKGEAFDAQWFFDTKRQMADAGGWRDNTIFDELRKIEKEDQDLVKEK